MNRVHFAGGCNVVSNAPPVADMCQRVTHQHTSTRAQTDHRPPLVTSTIYKTASPHLNVFTARADAEEQVAGAGHRSASPHTSPGSTDADLVRIFSMTGFTLKHRGCNLLTIGKLPATYAVSLRRLCTFCACRTSWHRRSAHGRMCGEAPQPGCKTGQTRWWTASQQRSPQSQAQWMSSFRPWQLPQVQLRDGRQSLVTLLARACQGQAMYSWPKSLLWA